MIKWIKSKYSSSKLWLLSKSPPPVKTFSEKYPRTFDFILLAAIILPWGLATLAVLNWLFGWPIWWLSSFFKWLGLVS